MRFINGRRGGNDSGKAIDGMSVKGAVFRVDHIEYFGKIVYNEF